jgi:hypothetical protein
MTVRRLALAAPEAVTALIVYRTITSGSKKPMMIRRRAATAVQAMARHHPNRRGAQAACRVTSVSLRGRRETSTIPALALAGRHAERDWRISAASLAGRAGDT